MEKTRGRSPRVFFVLQDHTGVLRGFLDAPTDYTGSAEVDRLVPVSR